MRRALLPVLVAALLSCDLDDSTGGGSQSGTFVLKFVNRGHYPITALYLRPATDTTAWGQSILPVDTLDSLEYVRIPGIAEVPCYAFRAQFDSAGVASYLTYASMVTGPDTITAHAALADYSWQVGHDWGSGSLAGERDVTP